MKQFYRHPAKWLCLTAAFSLWLTACQPSAPVELRQTYVDTRVGTAAATTGTAGLFGKKSEEHGQTIPAVLEPNGMDFWTPQTRDTEKKCIAPYYYADSLLQGFRNSHWLTGGCTQDYGSMTLMPLSRTLRLQPEARATRFSHDTETATPSLYRVELPDEDILVEMTGRARSAIFRFTYRTAGKAYLVINPNSDEGQGTIAIDPESFAVSGSNPVHRIYQGWGEPTGFSGHFTVQASKRPSAYGLFDADHSYPDSLSLARRARLGAYLEFDVADGEELLVKAATSFVSIEGAQANLQAEIPHWEFDRTLRQLSDIWEQRLAQVEVETPIREEKEKFYGALYRASMLPRTLNDVDGRYPSFATGTPIRQLPAGATYYDDFSMWDTYRALHPLINLLTPEKGGEMMQSLVYKYEQGGWLPIFPCWNSYTAAMIGDHCISVLADAYIKGIRNFDIQTAYRAMRQNAFDTPADPQEYRDGKGRRALRSYLQYGYIPLEDSVLDAYHTREQVSRTLEYAYDDYALAAVARELGRQADYEELTKRAQNYRHIIDPATGYAQGRHADGSFLPPVDPCAFARFITEGTPCHYTWYVPHDPQGLMECMGGREAYIAKLDSMFAPQWRYWHGNEPCHQVAYMYNFADQSWKTQEVVRHILTDEYQATPGGLAGNDDAGQMSAWYVFSALGFYPVCPASPRYEIGSPTFTTATIRPTGGKPFTIRAHGASPAHPYIQSATLNGEPLTRSYLLHEELTAGGTLELEMGPQPSTLWNQE